MTLLCFAWYDLSMMRRKIGFLVSQTYRANYRDMVSSVWAENHTQLYKFGHCSVLLETRHSYPDRDWRIELRWQLPSASPLRLFPSHYDDVIVTTMASQITSLTVVYATVYSDADQRKHQSSASLASVWGIHRDRWIPRTNGQLRGKCFHLMTSSWNLVLTALFSPYWWRS